MSTDGAVENLPLGRGVTMLVRDARGLMAFNKPAGVLSHPNRAGEESRALLQARYDLDEECYEWPGGAGERRQLWLLNRLDSATSGVILAAESAELAKTVRAQFQRKTVKKVYAALVFGAPKQSPETWRDRLAVQKQGGVIRTSAAAGHVPAESVMTVVRSNRGEPRLSLIRLEPRTGRSHQLRVQCAKRQLPIVGDQTYGDFKRNREFARVTGAKRLFLHSEATQFSYEFRGRTAVFAAQAPLPFEFAAALGV